MHNKSSKSNVCILELMLFNFVKIFLSLVLLLIKYSFKSLIEKITLKGNMLKLYFVSMEAQPNTGTTIIGQVIQFVNMKKRACQLREKAGKLILQVEKVSTIKNLNSILIDILG